MMDRLTTLWITAKRPYTKVDAWLMAHKPELWAEMYHHGLVFAILSTLGATLVGAVFWHDIATRKINSDLWLLLTVGLSLFWIWKRSRLRGCLPIRSIFSGWWSGVLDLLVCATIAFAPISSWVGAQAIGHLTCPNVNEDVAEAERLAVAWYLWQDIARQLSDSTALGEATKLYEKDRFAFSVSGLSLETYDPDLPPPDGLTAEDSDTNFAWSRYNKYAFRVMRQHSYNLEKWSHVYAALKVLPIQLENDQGQALTPTMLDKLAVYIQPIVDKHHGPTLPRGFDASSSVRNAELLASALNPASWKIANDYYNSILGISKPRIAKDAHQIGSIVPLIFLVMLTTVALPAVGSSIYWLSWGVWTAVLFVGEFEIGGLETSTIVCVIGVVLLIITLLHALLSFLSKSKFIIFCASMLAVQFPILWHSLNPVFEKDVKWLCALIALLVLNALARILFARLRSIPDAN